MKGRRHVKESVEAMAALAGVAIGGIVARLPVVVAQDIVVPSRKTVAFVGVTVIDVRDGKRLAEQTVMVEGTRIQAVGPTRTVHLSRGVPIVPARGKYLIPGFWDLHVHPMTYQDIFFPLFVANGVTGVRDAGSSVPLATQAQWKQEIAAG